MATSNNEKFYLQLIDAYKAAFPEKNGKVVQLDVSKLWLEIKQDKGGELSELIKKKIQELNRITMKKNLGYSISFPKCLL